jgi:hypothetical protein
MGVLDDAIREHLELKRRHGVPEEELERQEAEALGPARRDVAQQHEEAEPATGGTATAAADEPAPPAAREDTALFDMEEDAEPRADEPAPAEPAASEPTPVEPPPVEPPPAEPDEAPEPDEPDQPDEHAIEEPARHAALGDTEPHGFEAVEDDEPEGEEEEDEDPDVLEDTPDFLQETPEHDRLWFEQKPPRDFDFD